jgi:tRNA pseudouridine(55) synthase
MKRYVVLDKRVGQTPLQVIEEWKLSHPEYANIPAAYAGRLDPMASGKLLILLGDECKKIKQYTRLQKGYEIEVVVGLNSDTGDVLGIVQKDIGESLLLERMEALLPGVLAGELGKHEREYPVYSSKTVHGIPLFQYALSGTLSSIAIPTHTEEIFSIKHVSSEVWPLTQLQARVSSYLDVVPMTEEPSKVLGRNFRIDEVRASWEKIFTSASGRQYVVLKLSVICGSGTYMRTLAQRIGKSLGSCCLALSIHRKKIGRYVPFGRTMGMWWTSY